MVATANPLLAVNRKYHYKYITKGKVGLSSALSIRKALLLVALVSIIPALAIVVVTGIEHARSLEESATAQAHRYVDSVVGVQGENTESVRRLLATLAGLRAFTESDQAEQAVILADLLESNPKLLNLTATDTRGLVTVSAGIASGTDLSGRRHISQALSRNEFVVGEFITALIDDAPSLPFAYPVRATDGSVIGALSAVYPLAEFAAVFARLRLPEQTILGITDHRGTQLFFAPEEESNPMGSPVTPAIWHEMERDPNSGTIVNRGSDGIARFYAYRRVLLQGEDTPSIYVVLGYPVRQATAAARRVLLRNLILMFAVVVSAMIVALRLGGAVFGDALEQLAATARQISEGDLSARTGLPPVESELGEVARAIDEMAVRLERRVRLQAEEEYRITRSLREKEMLLREIHHRVKNNLQLILSIIRLQQSTESSIGTFSAALESRIRAITEVHELLYESSDLTMIPMQRLFRGLASVAAMAAGPPEISVDSPDISLPIETAMPLSLITNELITNSLRYGHREDRHIRILVSMRATDAGLELVVSDEGPGFPPDFTRGAGGGIGLQLVQALSSQLGGMVTFETADGARVTIGVPPPPGPSQERSAEGRSEAAPRDSD